MKKYFIITILFVGILPLFHSCTLPNGISIGNVGEDGEYINIHFDNISLNYDFRKNSIPNILKLTTMSF